MTAMRAPDVLPVLLPVAPDVPDHEISLDDLGSRIVGMAGRIAAATCRWLMLVAEFDRREGFARHGLPSTARWLSFACGLSKRTSVEHVRVARSLAAFPALAEAMASGALSYSHARAISRVPREGESGLVDELIELARHATIAQVEDTVRGLRTVENNTMETDVPARPEQYFSHSWTEQSQWRGQARLDPQNGALVQSVVETIARTERITAAEAFLRMAEIALAALNDSSTAPRPLRGDERAAVVVHVNAELISGELVAGDGDSPRSIERSRPVGRVHGGPGLSTAVIRQLMCIGRIRTVLHGAQGSPLDLGRSKRVVSTKLFRALLLRDGGCCTHPGCGSRAKLEAHHVRHWLYGGRTDLANLVLLCERHHHAHHDGEFTIVTRRDKSFAFVRSDGRELPAHVDPALLRDAEAPIELEHTAVADDAASGRWLGDRLDLGYAVAVLGDHRYRRTAGIAEMTTRTDPWDAQCSAEVPAG